MNLESSKVLDILEKVCGSPEIRENLDLDLLEEDILDSLGFVEMIVEISQTFGISISPAEIERSEWATPAKIIAMVESRQA